MLCKSALSQAVSLDLDSFFTGSASESSVYAAQYLRQEILSKYTTTEDRQVLSAATQLKFLSANQTCLTNMEEFHTLNATVVGEARHFLYRVLDSVSSDSILDLGLILQLWKHGPGAIRDSRATHFVQKAAARSCRYYPGMERLALLLLASAPRLAQHCARFAKCLVEVPGNEYFEVPKNDEENRVCAKEADIAMAYQLATHAYVCRGLAKFGIVIGNVNFREFGFTHREQRNKFQAKLGSEGRGIATLDLRQASNLITPRLIKELWPPEWYHWLMLIRAPSISINGTNHELHMLSTMGCGFTFSVMTATLAAIIYGINRVYGKSGGEHIFFSNQFGVFGDDVIVPDALYDRTCEVLMKCGLQVNPKKSFATGKFRESCGGHYYDGHDITPLYIRKTSTVPQKYVLLNGIIDYSQRTGIYLHNLFRLVRESLGEDVRLVPHWENPDAGLKYGGRITSGPYWAYHPKRTSTCRSFKGKPFLFVWLALGGYIQPAGPLRAQYTCRTHNVEYELTECQMPDGFLTGTDFRNKKSVGRELIEDNYLI